MIWLAIISWRFQETKQKQRTFIILQQKKQHTHIAPGTTTTKKPTQNIFQWLQGRKETVLQGRKKLKPSSTDEGDAMTAMKQRFLRENCGCSHPACSHNLICPCMYAGEHWISFNTIQPKSYGQGGVKKERNKPLHSNLKTVPSNICHKAATN